MVQDYEAWGVNIGYNPSTMQRISTQATTWTLVSVSPTAPGMFPSDRMVLL